MILLYYYMRAVCSDMFHAPFLTTSPLILLGGQKVNGGTEEEDGLQRSEVAGVSGGSRERKQEHFVLVNQ